MNLLEFDELYDEEDIENLSSSDCIGFADFVEADNFCKHHQNFKLYKAHFNEHHKENGWSIDEFPEHSPLDIIPKMYGDDYDWIEEGTDFAIWYMRDNIKDMCWDDVFSKVQDLQSLIDEYNDLEMDEMLICNTKTLQTHTIKHINAVLFDDFDGHITRIVAVRK